MQVELPAQLLSTEANVLAVPLVAPSQAGPGPWFDQVGPEFVPVPEPPALATLAVALVVLLLLRLLHGRPS